MAVSFTDGVNHCQTLSHNVVWVHFTISGIRTTLVVIDTDSIGSCKSTITTTPKYCWKKQDTSITPYDSNISQVILDYCSTFCFNFQSKYSSPWECYLTKMLCKYGMVLWLDDVQTFSSNNNWKYDFMGGLQTFNLKFYFKSIFIKQLQTYIFPQEKENQQYQYYVW